MRIAKTDKTDDISKFIMDIYDAGRKIGGLEVELGTGGHILYDHSKVVPGALKRLDEAGFEIVRKGERATAAVAPVMPTVNLNLDDSLALGSIDPDVTTGIAKMGDDYVRVLHVRAAHEFTVPLAYETPPEAALRLAAAIIEWDVGMMEAADGPFSDAGPKLSIRQTIRNFLPCMLKCEFRDLFVDTYGYAGELA